MKKRQAKTPTFYVRKRLFRNKPALIGLIIILFAHLIALLGYLIMPDSTPDANDGSALIKKKPAGFQVSILKKLKNREVADVNFFEKVFFGQESKYTFFPISNLEINGLNARYSLYGKEKEVVETPIITFVKPLFVGKSPKLKPDSSYNFKVDGDVITYLDHNEAIQKVHKAELIEEFNEANFQERTYLLGTDKAGRDILSRLLFGTRISLSIGFIAVLISLFVGVTLGGFAGYFGGYMDKMIMWLMTVVWSIPGIMLVIAISLAVQSKGIWVAFVAVGLTMWVEVARVVRGQIMSIKEKLYVEAATALGIGSFRIIFIHILPNIMGPIIVIATANFASAILIEAGLSFLGLGVQPPMPSWGMMVNEGYNSNWESDGGYLVILPSLFISILVLSFNLFGNGLRDAYDPQTAVKW
ncbi:MAG TPA: ABC transporter permease [Cytophagaceae bacterium]|jgi:peptide/nickel transport system permease protein